MSVDSWWNSKCAHFVLFPVLTRIWNRSVGYLCLPLWALKCIFKQSSRSDRLIFHSYLVGVCSSTKFWFLLPDTYQTIQGKVDYPCRVFYIYCFEAVSYILTKEKQRGLLQLCLLNLALCIWSLKRKMFKAFSNPFWFKRLLALNFLNSAKQTFLKLYIQLIASFLIWPLFDMYLLFEQDL